MVKAMFTFWFGFMSGREPARVLWMFSVLQFSYQVTNEDGGKRKNVEKMLCLIWTV